MNINMCVVKRNGSVEEMSFDKILKRIQVLGNESPALMLNYSDIAIKVIHQLYDKIETTNIDKLSAEQCASMASQHPDYGSLASRIVVSNHHKNTPALFSEVMERLYVTDSHKPLLSTPFYQFVKRHAHTLDSMIVHSRDYLIDYFGFKTLEQSYLFKIDKLPMERPQHMWMRVAVGIHACHAFATATATNDANTLALIQETYDMMSQKWFTHATPTLFNAGTPRPQLSSCFLLEMEEDSIEGIYNTLKDCALISKYSGGIGMHIHNVRSKGSYIQGSNGVSDGIVPMLRVFNETARYANQSGRRNGSFAIYVEPWHPDIFDFLEMKKNHGNEERRARDLFYALWIPDLFMERVKEEDGTWSLFCPHECPGLSDAYGDAFCALYHRYESEGRAKQTVSARKLWFAILDAQMETGTPYLLYKDAANKKSNQKNLGTIKSSNLCCEIMEYSNDKETSVCNLASIALPSCVTEVATDTETTAERKYAFDFEKLHRITRVVTRNLNKIIDLNYYPTDKTRRSNLRHRPIGIGVQGLADTFVMLDMAFHSDEAMQLNRLIFETMYHGALEESNDLSRCRGVELQRLMKSVCQRGQLMEYINNEYEMSVLSRLGSTQPDLLGAYCTFEGSPASLGKLQFDLWDDEEREKRAQTTVEGTAGTEGTKTGAGTAVTSRYDWDTLKAKIQQFGLRNSLLIAPMPTASTSQILGCNECFEPFTSNLYSRKTLAGEFMVVNRHLTKELIALNMWNETVKNSIVRNKGSIQHLTSLPQHVRDKYKIAWEIPMKHVIDMAAERARFICQSQSMNLWMADPNYTKMTSMHFYAWKKGLKTGMYYLRRKSKHQAQQFTLEPEKEQEKEQEKKKEKEQEEQKEEQKEEEQVCQVCSA